MPGIEDAPREVARTVSQANNSAVKRAHPMVIVAAVAVTLFSGVGIAVMTGLIPNAQSGSGSSTGTSAPPTPMVAGAAQAMAGNASEPALPQSASTPSSTPHSASNSTKAVSKHASTESRQVATSRAASNDARTSPAPTPNYEQRNAAPTTPICRSCGVVESVEFVKQEGSGSGAGAVLGGVVGGLLGHQVGGGRGKDVATVAGAVGGAVLGNQIEKNRNATQQADIRVRLEDGSVQTIRSASDLGLRNGDNVRVENGKITRI